MVEKDLEFARQAIIAGKTPLRIRRYRRNRLFWVIFWIFFGILLLLSISRALPWDFWKGIVTFSPAFLFLAFFRKMFATSPSRDLCVIAAALAILGLAAINGSAQAGLPLEGNLPAGLIKAAGVPVI